MIEQYDSKKKAFTLRALALSLSLAILYTCINGYLGINFGMGFGFGAVTIVIAYAVLHRLFGGSSRSEISVILISSSSLLTVHFILGFLLYLIENSPSVNLPYWLAPPRDVVISKSLSLGYWVTPISFIVLTQIFSSILGLIFSIILSGEFLKSKRMIFPYTAISASLIDSCFKGGAAAKLVGYSAIIGLVVTILQYSASFIGFNLTVIDLTPY